jgi:hypothetical protein
MLDHSFNWQSAVYCPLCGLGVVGVNALGRHLAFSHDIAGGRGMSLARLLMLDIEQAIKLAGSEQLHEQATAWDITASQAAGRDVPRRRS